MENKVSVKITGDSSSLNTAAGQADKSLQTLGVSAKQTSAALRGVPAQFTDIVTSIQGGQAPLTVLLQQGGQLKDMFGGVGPAAKALAGYVWGLISPLTVVAGTLGAVGAAYYYGSEQSKRLENALISSGNIIGQTSSQLETLIETTGRVTGHYTQSREAVEALAASGVIAGGDLQTALRGVMAMSELTGKSVDDLVPKFEEIAKDPFKAIVKLNEQYNFLTVDVYKQIKALEEQGKKTEAATLAMETFADAVEGRKGQVLENIGLFEKAWRSVKGAIDSAKQSFLDVGRDPTLDEKIKAANNQLNSESAKQYPKLKAQYQAELDDLMRIKKTSETLAADVGKSRADAKAKINQSENLDKYINDSSRYSGADLINKKIADENKAFATATQGFSKTSKEYISALTRHEAAIANIKASSNKGKSSVDQDAEAAKRFVEQLSKQADTLGQSKSELLEYEAAHLKLSDATKRTVAQDIAKIKALEDQKAAQEALNDAIEQNNQMMDAVQASDDANQTIYDQNAAAYEAMLRQNEDLNVDLIANDKARAQAQIEIEKARALEVIALREAARQSQGEISEAETAQYEAQREAVEQRYELSMKKIETQTKSSADTGRQLGLTFSSAFEDAAISGKKLSDVLGGLAQDIERILLRKTVTEPLANAIGGIDFGDLLGSAPIGSAGTGDGILGALSGMFSWMVPGNHTGGIVGSESTFTRAVNPAIFNGAPRYHTGGIVGDEVPSILKRGEGVFTQEQMRNLSPVGKTSAGNVVVNIIGAPSQPGVTQTRDANGNMSMDIVFDKIKSELSRDIRRDGAFASTLQDQYGLSRVAGGR